jgi:hypothetical protein
MDPSWKWCPVCIAPVRGWLVHLTEDKHPLRVCTIHEGTSLIGQGLECEIRVSGTGVTLLPQHASLTVAGGVCSIMNMDADDPQSMQINNQGRSGVVSLIDGDIIRLAGALFQIKLLT